MKKVATILLAVVLSTLLIAAAADGSQFKPCDSPYSVNAKSKGGKGKLHTIAVQAIDDAGNAGKAATAEFRVIRK